MMLSEQGNEPRNFFSNSAQSEKRAGDRAYERFCTPHLSDRRAENHDALIERSRKHLGHAVQRVIETRDGPVSTYVLEPDSNSDNSAPVKTVLLIHGWTCEASFMSVIAESLRRSGFRVLLIDLPAHGLSPGTKTSIVACARAVTDVIDAFGPIDFTVSHSLGGFVSLLASAGGAAVKKARPMSGYVFISMPNDFRDITTEFTDDLGLSKQAARQFETRLEVTAGYPLSELNAESFLGRIDRPALLIHCEDDDEIPVDCAYDVAASTELAQLETVRGLGHRKILYASRVARSAAGFLKQLSATQDEEKAA